MEELRFNPNEQPAAPENTDTYYEGDFSVAEDSKALGHASIGKEDNPPNPYRDPKDLFMIEDPDTL